MNKKNKIAFLTAIMIVGVFAGTSAFALNDFFTSTYRNFIRSAGFIDPALESECQSQGANNIVVFDENGQQSVADICSNDYDDDPFNFTSSNYSTSHDGAISKSGTIYQIFDLGDGAGQPQFICTDPLFGGQDEQWFLDCVADPASSTSIIFSESYPDVYAQGHAISNFMSMAIDVSFLVATFLFGLIAVLAALLGLGFAISRVKRWITGRKA